MRRTPRRDEEIRWLPRRDGDDGTMSVSEGHDWIARQIWWNGRLAAFHEAGARAEAEALPEVAEPSRCAFPTRAAARRVPAVEPS